MKINDSYELNTLLSFQNQVSDQFSLNYVVFIRITENQNFKKSIT